MKIDKDYPATHSMSTSWYIVDEEGNVGILDFNENGPVPRRIEQTGIEDLVFGHCEDWDKHRYLTIKLNQEQIKELLDHPRNPEEVDYWYNDIVQIDLSKEVEFLEFAKNKDFVVDSCISKEMGLYQITCKDSIVDGSGKIPTHVRVRSTLKKVLDAGIIQKVYDVRFFDIDDMVDVENSKVVHEKNFENAPYYIYHQPYWINFLPERMNVPVHPVKIEQLPMELQRRAFHIPVKFKECEGFQIAEWYLSNLHSNEDEDKQIDGFHYALLPMTNGTEAYVNTDLIPDTFYQYCSEKAKYGCECCSWTCYKCDIQVFCNKPTVMVIVSPFQESVQQLYVKSDVILEHAIQLPYLPRIPNKHPKGYFTLHSDVIKRVSREQLEQYYYDNYKWMEDMIVLLNPQVIIADAKALRVLSKQYRINDHQICINNKLYPFYKKAEIKTYRKQIEELAFKPYQGKEIPYIISKEEMKKLKTDK